MLEDTLWEQFTESGSVADYLNYAAQKGCNGFADSEGCGSDSETSR